MVTRRGFTIIELIVAVSIIVLFAAVALPRYNQLTESQDFSDKVQKITECLQKARTIAGSTLDGGQNYRFVEVRMTQGNNSLSCNSYGYDSTNSLSAVVSSNLTRNSLTPAVAVSGVYLLGGQTTATSQKTIALDSSMRTVKIIFGSLESGVPVAVSCDSCSVNLGAHNASDSPNYVPYGQGIAVELDLYNNNSQASSSNQDKINVGTFGVPISYTSI